MNKRRTLIRKQNESKKGEKRKQKRENVLEEDIDLGRFFELATSNKKDVNGLNLHEIKTESFEIYTGVLELIGEIEQKTKTRFKNVDDFETYINAIDNSGYDSDDVIFTGWLYKLNTLELKKVSRSKYGRSTDFRQDIV